MYELNSEEYFRTKLAPVCRQAKYAKIKVGYDLMVVKGELKGHEYTVKVTGKQALGLEPMALRHSCLDDPGQIADFLLLVGTGKLHPSCFQYMLGPYTQYQIATGQRKGFGKLIGGEHKPAETPTERIMKGFDENVKIDDDYKRIARKKDFDTQLTEKILGERPHLLDSKGDPLK